MNITLDASEFSQLAAFWERAPDLTRAALGDAVERIDAELGATLRRDLPAGAGRSAGLRNSIHHEEAALADTVIGMVYSTMPYAAYVEFGTRPHRVSAEGIQSLADWVQAKFNEDEGTATGIAHAIAWKIRRQGTPANPVWQRTWEGAQPRIRATLEVAMRRIADALAGGGA